MTETFTIIHPLGDGQTLLARDAIGRRVVLKPLPRDVCLPDNCTQAFAFDFSASRELADTAVANFHGVVQERGEPYLVWEFIPGRTIEQARDVDERWLARELRLAVRTLHIRGMVHGALHERNAIIDDSGRLRLTHLSPLLYDAPSFDDRAIDRTLQRRAGQESGDASPPTGSTAAPPSPRRRAAVAAGAVALIGIALAWWIAQATTPLADRASTPRPSRAGDWVAPR